MCEPLLSCCLSTRLSSEGYLVALNLSFDIRIAQAHVRYVLFEFVRGIGITRDLADFTE